MILTSQRQRPLAADLVEFDRGGPAQTARLHAAQKSRLSLNFPAAFGPRGHGSGPYYHPGGEELPPPPQEATITSGRPRFAGTPDKLLLIKQSTGTTRVKPLLDALLVW
jgi:hypothetical protein